ncbi:EmrB/QacA subfamily drug resistance transporter [Kitasatospora viridis]|uniref:EmrB/QacA subfamily drug resistance transporter n=2 Tax=Kitasatospora viridis TaxID=281105 RepID=A0A561UM83_9ACTN|nr:MFS transporter [Kitasatospora viridis]TWG00488.1 EmrB/QacA subfamily drug resistance transporter [Kitasatospora viridis]
MFRGHGSDVSSPDRRRWLALLVLCAGVLMIILDGTIVTVAQPAIQHDLGFTDTGLSWVMNAYQIPFAGLLLLAGRLGDLLGRKRVYLAGLALFAAASALCGLAGSAGMLIAARFVQGAGGALVSAVALGMIVTLFPDPAERGRAIGVFSFVGAAGASLGMVLGGVLTQLLNWHWIFLVNLPIALAAGLPAVRLLDREAGQGLREGADALGAVLVTAGLMLGVYTIVGTGSHGWGSAHTLGFGAAALVLLAGFLLRQARAARPLLPLRLFRSRATSGANLVQLLMIAAMFGFQVLIALHLQEVLGWSPARTGFGMLPTGLAIGAVSLGLSARLIRTLGTYRVLLVGIGMLVLSLAYLTRMPQHASYPVDVLPALLLIAGGGLAMPALAGLAMRDATPADSGVASGLFNTSQTVASALGVAVLGTLAAGRAAHSRAAGHPAARALADGHRLAFGVAAVLLALAFAAAAVLLRERRAAAAEPVALAA